MSVQRWHGDMITWWHDEMVTFKNDEGQTLGHMVYSKVQHFVAQNPFSEYKNV